MACKKAIIVAAGQGSRLQPFTREIPKCMVCLHGRPLLAWQVSALRHAGIGEIVVVRGCHAERIDLPGLNYVENPAYAQTNMVQSLFCAREYFAGGFVLCYGDIVYNTKLVSALSTSQRAGVLVTVDRDWLPYWQARFEDPLADAESLRINGDRIVEIGQRASSVAEIEGQFIGLVRFDESGLEALTTLYAQAEALQREGRCLQGCPRQLDAMYTTDLLQALALRKHLWAQSTRRGWLEVDSVSDLLLAHERSSLRGQLLHIEEANGSAQ